MARYLSDGSPDPSFGIAGLVTAAVVRGQYVGASTQAVGILPNQSILALGSAQAGLHPCPRIALVKLDPDGSPVAAFGSRGNGVSPPPRLPSPFGCSDVRAGTVLPNGKSLMVAAGTLAGATPLAFARYTPEGVSDSTLGSKRGFVELIPPGSGRFRPGSSVIGLGRGGVLVGATVAAARCFGSTSVSGGRPCRVIELTRYRRNGSFKRSFGRSGRVVTPDLTLCRRTGPRHSACRPLSARR
jgi:hypothetical protein